MITRAQLALAAFTLALVAAIAIAVTVIVAKDDGGGDSSTHGLSRDLTAAAGGPSPTHTATP